MRIYEDARVSSIAGSGGALRLRTPGGQVAARKVAYGGGAFPGPLRRLRLWLVPVYDYALMSEPLSESQMERIGWRNRQGIGDTPNQFHYYRLTEDNRILWGGYDAIYYYGSKITAGQDQRPATFTKLAEHFFGTFPQLADVTFSHKLVGRRDRHVLAVLRLLRHGAGGPVGDPRPVTPGSASVPAASAGASCSTCWPASPRS